MSAHPQRRVDAVLFDLDGTLVDSAPDLAGAANDLRAAAGMAALPLATLRPMVGAGARGMVGLALGLKPGDAGYEDARAAFLTRYAQRLLQDTYVFAAVEPLLRGLSEIGMPWGIVTNKAFHLAEPIVKGLGPLAHSAVLIGGDTTAHAKPHPMPLLEAARRMALAPERCVYVGDDERDMQAAKAAGMPGVAAAWGYLGLGEPVQAWGADAIIEKPEELLKWLALP